jgi:hypothetical protein
MGYTCEYIYTTHALSPKGWQRHLRYSSQIPMFYRNYLAMSSTADVTGGKLMGLTHHVGPFPVSGCNIILYYYSYMNKDKLTTAGFL